MREFGERAFAAVGLDYRQYVNRPAEVELVVGDATKAKKVLGWQPKHTFDDLVRIMVESDLESLELEAKAASVNRAWRA